MECSDQGSSGENPRDYADSWLRARSIKPRTRSHYRRILDRLILPHLGNVQLSQLTSVQVRSWHADLEPDTPVMNAHAYSLLRSIYLTAVNDELVPASPCRIRGAGSAAKVHQTEILDPAEVDSLAAAMPAQWKALILISAWVGLRFGEATELRRKDVDLKERTIRVSRAVTRVDNEYLVSTPKSTAGRRLVAVPPHIIPMIQRHLAEFVEADQDALLFPGEGGKHLPPSTLYGSFWPARKSIGHPSLHWHDLRHCAGTWAAQNGATLAELQARLGHSTVQAAMRYQHAAEGRDRVVAEALSEFAKRSTSKNRQPTEASA